MTFLLILIAAVLGVFTGKYVFLMTQKKQVPVSTQYSNNKESVLEVTK